jgi:hypothetical protein
LRLSRLQSKKRMWAKGKFPFKNQTNPFGKKQTQKLNTAVCC